jgi:hypothetical protein
LYARFDPAVALDADDPAYVDWQEELRLSDLKQQLANCVRLTTTGYSHLLAYWSRDQRWYGWNPLLGCSKLHASTP